MLKICFIMMFFMAVNLSFVFGDPILDQSFPANEANREDLSIGSEKNDIFFVDKKPTKVSKEDIKWLKMVMHDGWTYMRTSDVSIDGKGYTSSLGGFYDKEIYLNWRAEVAWSSQILYNDGQTIIELRNFMPNNQIALIESKIKIKCTTCLKAGQVIHKYAKAWKKAGNRSGALAKVQTVVGDIIDFVGFQFDKAKIEVKEGRRTKVLKDSAGDFQGFLQKSLFSNKWYIIQYSLASSNPDKLMRVELEGDVFKPWNKSGSTKQEQKDEQLRRQTIIRSAYLMDAGILPKDKKIETIGKTWRVSASVFGQVVGNDVASDLDEISGSITLRREKNINIDNAELAYIVKTGSSADNRIKFVYKPTNISSMSKVNKSIAIDPERIDIFFNTKRNHIHRIKLDGKVNIEMAKHITLWPDTNLTVEPYVEAVYTSEVIDEDIKKDKANQITLKNLSKFINKNLNIDIEKKYSDESRKGE